MAVYEFAYRVWEGERRGPLQRWLTIPRFVWMSWLAQRGFVTLIAVAWMPFLIRLFIIYLLANTSLLNLFRNLLRIPAAQLPEVAPWFFANTIDVQIVFAVILLVRVGAGLLAKDFEHRAYVLYFAKPLTRWEYVLGKAAALWTALMLVLWVPTALLFVCQVAASPPTSPWRTEFWSRYAFVGWAITVYALAVAIVFTILTLACSILTRNTRHAGTLIAVCVLGTFLVAPAVAEAADRPAWTAVSLIHALRSVGMDVFALTSSSPVDPAHAWTSLLAWSALGAWVLHRRLQAALQGESGG